MENKKVEKEPIYCDNCEEEIPVGEICYYEAEWKNIVICVNCYEESKEDKDYDDEED